jgi:periplasmic divalent cation tolerance protein
MTKTDHPPDGLGFRHQPERERGIMTAVTLFAVFADMAEADRIGRQMVEERLAACVNILQPCRSIYRWEGAVETASEVPAFFKTTMDAADRLIERITELHSYSVPALAVWPIAKLPVAYGDWVEESLG